jgi:hypothetical protein
MSVFRAVFLLSLVSLLVAAALFFLGSAAADYKEFRGGYAVLTVDSSIEDRDLRGILEKSEGIFGESPVSESSQWVMLDNFGSLETIPLDTYSSRLFSFDPRNDGYAGKLKSVFVQDDKRFVYMPLNAGNWNAALLDKQFQSLLGDIPFSVEYYGVGTPLFLFFTVYAAASLCVLVICYVKRNTHRGTEKVIPLVAPFSSLSFFGAPGIASAAVLLGFFLFLREPLDEFVNIRRFFKKDNAQMPKLIYKNIVKPYGWYFLFLPVFAAALYVLVVFTRLKLLFLIAVFAVSLALFFFSSRIMSVTLNNRRRFNPVLIIKRRLPDFAFSMFMLPLSAAAFLAVFFTPYVSSPYVSDRKFDAIIDEQDYYAHLIYQATFSTRQLGTSFADFSDYIYGEDGLLSPDGFSGKNPVEILDDFPPFPLKNLMAFFIDVNNGKRTNNSGGTGGLTEKLPLLVLLLFIFPLFFVNRKDSYAQKSDLSCFKKPGEKKRLVINRNNSYVYSGKNTLRVRKDA